ncbi:MarR family winged helix-turn-helix transcriptional regulator [Streptomyces sp. SP17KL33]|uniref:MarR family winged helix-turn-helix transcriptional regulator n=1 Tax=Streptomyces sp. SP17KL33 TaxID=3002534 RepID=UPI002E75BF7B|nr:MarR family transcriptional regulator [Streptomyces sp. SP17KL33]MEE1829492.1 MarR family transcriptional regulator [Streptomyces sp. SP17KL33]
MITDRVSFTLARMGRVAETELRQALAERGLKLSHAHVLGLLAERERVSQQALLEELRVDPSVLVTVLNGLEENGLVTRRRDPADRRRHVVEISDLGTELVAQADSAVRAAEAKLFADLDEQDVTALRRLLGLIRATGANACEE